MRKCVNESIKSVNWVTGCLFSDCCELTCCESRHVGLKTLKKTASRAETEPSVEASQWAAGYLQEKHTVFTSSSFLVRVQPMPFFAPRSCDPDAGPVSVETTSDTAGTEKKKRHFSNGWFVCRLLLTEFGHRGALLSSHWPDAGGTW